MCTGNYHVFGKANLSGQSLELFTHTWARVLGGMPSMLKVKHLWLRADPHVAEARMKARARDGESGVPLAYLELLDRLHAEWLEGAHPGTETHSTVDANRGADAVWESVCHVLKGWASSAANSYRASSESEIVGLCGPMGKHTFSSMFYCANRASEKLGSESRDGSGR